MTRRRASISSRGLENRRGLFFEFKLGVADSPDFKFGVGFTFR